MNKVGNSISPLAGNSISPLAGNSISPLDGRYHSKTQCLSKFFGEKAYMRHRVITECKYLLYLLEKKIVLKKDTNVGDDFYKIVNFLDIIIDDNDDEMFSKIKQIEQKTNHDVKAVEYYLKDVFENELNISMNVTKYVHFAITSHDINSVSNALRIRDAMNDIMIPEIDKIIEFTSKIGQEWKDIPMLAKTHGQIASPTTFGKEMRVYMERMQNVAKILKTFSYKAKFGGAVGNLNAHYATCPDVDWIKFTENFLQELKLDKNAYTTQVDHYDNLARLFDELARMNTILVDFSRDMWLYISNGYLKQKVVATEVGSSTMPHKINPINFENSEGNALLANALLKFLSGQLPVSRLQRDLVNSTLFRNIGVAFGYTLLSWKSFYQGLQRIEINTVVIEKELESNYQVLAEPVQNILKIHENDHEAYEKLKGLCRSNESLSKEQYIDFIENLKEISEKTKTKLLKLTPIEYIGKFV